MRTPTEISGSQDKDLKRFFRDFERLNPWDDLYSFFGVPDEPAKRGEE